MGWGGGAVGKKGQALLKAKILRSCPFLSHRPPMPLTGFRCSLLGTSQCLSHHTGTSAHQTVRAHTHRNITCTTKGEAQGRVRTMEGEEYWGTGVRCQHSGRKGGRRHSWSWDVPEWNLG